MYISIQAITIVAFIICKAVPEHLNIAKCQKSSKKWQPIHKTIFAMLISPLNNLRILKNHTMIQSSMFPTSTCTGVKVASPQTNYNLIEWLTIKRYLISLQKLSPFERGSVWSNGHFLFLKRLCGRIAHARHPVYASFAFSCIWADFFYHVFPPVNRPPPTKDVGLDKACNLHPKLL